MKHSLLSLLAILITTTGWGQLADLLDGEGNVVNGEVLVHWGDHETPNQDVSVYVVLNGTESRTLNVRRYEMDVEPNTQNYFCWGVCYNAVDAGTSPVWYSQHSLTLEPDVPANNFHAYHSPQGVIGASTYRYVWYDVEATDDTVWVDITFQVTSVGIEENSAATGLNLYPNPATGSEVMISYQLDGGMNNSVIAFRNMVGQVVFTQRIEAPIGRLFLPIAELPAGIYFATIEHQERILATQRLIISH